MTTNTWPLPWRIAAALARESGLDWARWAYGEYYCDCDTDAMIVPGVEYIDGQAVVCPTCGLAWQVSCDTDSDPYVLTDFDLGIPDPSDAESYRADCARRGVDPGPMPALEYVGEGVEWLVLLSSAIVIVGRLSATIDAHAVSMECGRDTPDRLARLSALATAAARAGSRS
jgi:hypothetical protein